MTTSQTFGWTATQFIPISFDTKTFDNDNLFDATDHTLRAPIAGVYQIDAGVEWAPDANGDRFLGLEVGGACCKAGNWTAADGSVHDTIQNVSDLLHLNAGDVVQAVAEENSGTTLGVESTQGTFLAMHWVGP